MSIAAQCSDCCTCPQPTVQWDSRSASKTKVGWYLSGAPATRYRSFDVNYEKIVLGAFDQADRTLYYNGPNTITNAGVVTNNLCRKSELGVSFEGCTTTFTTASNTCALSFGFSVVNPVIAEPNPGSPLCSTSGSRNAILGNEYTTADLIAYTEAALPAFDDDWDDTSGSLRILSSDEMTYAIRESRYRIRFKIPLVNTGLNYRVFWVERFIPEAGVGMTSVEVYSTGVYRPTVTISAPPAGGTQARAVAVMSATGTVASIRILNPGAGYTSAPTVTVQSATGGGTSSTGWTATLTAGQVTSITGGSAGNYLPTLAFSSGGGSGATATATMDDRGGISAVTIGASGSGYTSAPTLAITAKVTGSTAADLLLHLGTETPRCAVWDGITPGGYDPDDATTYPIIGDGTNAYWELPVPSADGTTLVANLRAVCDGTACP